VLTIIHRSGRAMVAEELLFHFYVLLSTQTEKRKRKQDRPWNKAA